ncbi:hypothetical protein Tco_0252495 [Tanacetum coccineum]
MPDNYGNRTNCPCIVQKDLKKQIRYFQQENKKGRNKSGEKGKCLHKGRERKGGLALINRKKGYRKGTHLDRATTRGIGIWKEINIVLLERQISPFNDSATKGNNGQSRQRQDECCCYRDPSRGSYHCAQLTPLTLDREGMTMGSQTVRRRTQPLYTRERWKE